MRRVRGASLSILVGGVVILGLLVVKWNVDRTVTADERRGDSLVVVTDPSLPAHPPYAVDEGLIHQGIATSATFELPTSPHLLGGVIPHHLLPSDLTAGFFELLAQQEPQTLILMGPNHEETGPANILTGRANWETDEGLVLTNQAGIDRLLTFVDIVEADTVLATEHSLSALMPFIAHYLPETAVVPLALKRRISLGEVHILSVLLASLVDERTVVVASVDFSHGLSRRAAATRDEQTRTLLRQGDLQSLLGLDNTFTDSPGSLATVLETMSLAGAGPMVELANTNAGLILGDGAIPVTSYFVLAFPET